MIHETVKIGKNVVLGEHAVIEENVVIGDNVTVGHHAIIKKDTQIGSGVKIGDLAVLGKAASSNKKMARQPKQTGAPLRIEEDAVVGASAVIYRDVLLEQGVFVGDMASIRENVAIGRESIIGRNAMVENNTRIGKRVTIQTGCYITADMTIEDEVFIGPCCSTSNDKYMGMGNYPYQGPTIKKGAKIGNNATLLPAVVIGEHAVIGAGAVITKDVPAGKTAVGNPGRLLK
ncbi:DapH/DapD/GlmU-related protein [Bacillus haynesii]|uniref:N-acetyltransferase n=1 Tax=Bacillus haynesii TaxID=1925021 RepID=UPI001593C724|nr:N-acetyltransferase [Bacillus haynesii]NVB35831.1 N-acetyltransferase [Bacillus licheniformis]MCY7781170.1 N-acetyltransferase [Bacillus haynesii]MEC0672239.1 DapH/DapD/GlmU-related protein [Bacillus haynesii]MEC1420081.1 DapH/DapD/GlmU-related protein [Bacillus haynesii]MEC1469974.1 DapH/DapD/GlmU-related protein [Bacillus haynesii]